MFFLNTARYAVCKCQTWSAKMLIRTSWRTLGINGPANRSRCSRGHDVEISRRLCACCRVDPAGRRDNEPLYINRAPFSTRRLQSRVGVQFNRDRNHKARCQTPGNTPTTAASNQTEACLTIERCCRRYDDRSKEQQLHRPDQTRQIVMSLPKSMICCSCLNSVTAVAEITRGPKFTVFPAPLLQI